MAVFVYKATDRSGKLVSGTMEGRSREAIVAKLQETNLYPLKVAEQGAEKAGSSANIFSAFQRIKTRDVMTFTQHLSILTEAGLPLDRSLTILRDLTENKKLAKVIDNVLKSVQGGSSLNEALARHPKIFSSLYVNMVKAGESGGVLEIVVNRLGEFLANAQALREDIVSAMIYPVLLTLVAGSAVAVLLLFVVPKFADMFMDMGQALPLPTQILLSCTDILTGYWWLILGVLIAAIIIFRYYVGTESGKHNWDDCKLKMPMLGELIKKIEAARFARTLGTLIRSGVPILQGISIVKDIIANSVIARAMQDISSGLKEGGGITTPLRESDIFPPLVVHMIGIGEETGQLDNMLIKVADTYDEEIRSNVKRLVSLLEPAMILIMGIIVGFIVVAMLMAIFSVNQMPF